MPFRVSAWVLLLAGLVSQSVVAGQLGQSRLRHEKEWDVKARKMETRLLPAMRSHGIEMWIILSRENHPDPLLDVFGAYGVSGWYGHRNAYIFYDTGDTLETTVIGTHLSEHSRRFFINIVAYGEDGLAPLLRRHVEERDPETIAINESRTISMADGLSSSLKAYLVDAVGEAFAARLVSSEPLAIDYISYRTDGEFAIEREASHLTYNLLRRAFSNEVITPGKTTLMDVHWWIVDAWKAQDLEFNFPPHLNVQRRGHADPIDDADDPLIEPGDLLHVDFGVRLMGLVTDQQKMAYVLRPGEFDAPAAMRQAFLESRRVGAIICEELKPGVPGHIVKERAEERGLGEGILSSVYPHAQGNWVHGAGAWVSFDWPERYGNHPREPVRAREIWSIEYSTSLELDVWDDQRISILREEDAWIDDDGDVHYFSGPQEALWLISSSP